MYMKPQMRRVVKLGRSTLAVTLPKEWVESVKLKKGDYILAEEGEANTLRISKSKERFYSAPKVCVINLDSLGSKTLLTRVIIGSYAVGHELIWLQSRRGFTPDQIVEVNKILQKLVGLHIIEQTENIMLLQSLADPSKPSLHNSIRRLYLLTYSMLESIILSLSEWNRSLLDNVLFTGGECDNMYWLIIRQLLTAAGDKSVSETLGVKSYLWLVGNRAIIRLLKILVRNNEQICRWLIRLMDKGLKLDDEAISKIIELSRDTLQMLSDAIESLLTRDIEKANRIIDYAIRKAEGVDDLSISLSNTIRDGLMRAAALNILCTLQCSMYDIKGIAEIAINRGTEESGSYIIIETGVREEGAKGGK